MKQRLNQRQEDLKEKKVKEKDLKKKESNETRKQRKTERTLNFKTLKLPEQVRAPNYRLPRYNDTEATESGRDPCVNLDNFFLDSIPLHFFLSYF